MIPILCTVIIISIVLFVCWLLVVPTKTKTTSEIVLVIVQSILCRCASVCLCRCWEWWRVLAREESQKPEKDHLIWSNERDTLWSTPVVVMRTRQSWPGVWLCCFFFLSSVFVLWDSCLVAGACGREKCLSDLSALFSPLFRTSRWCVLILFSMPRFLCSFSFFLN